MQIILQCFVVLHMIQLFSFQDLSLYGQLIGRQSNKPIDKASLNLEGLFIQGQSEVDGSFHLKDLKEGTFLLRITAAGFVEKRLPIELTYENIDLGILYLDLDITQEKTDNLITLNELDFSDNEEVVSSAGLLRATRDIYLSRAAFDFSQAFFKIRGYDSREATVLLNGHKMNKLSDGRPQWNNWGGLNDITRNQELIFGLKASRLTFGGLLGVTNIDTRPTKLRPGTKFSVSIANRTYSGRLMATYNSGQSESGLSYAISGSKRFGNQGFIDGTFYGAYSIYGSLEYRFNEKNSLDMTAIFASNKRGQSAAITEEVFKLVGNKYNPYWGYQKGKIRNSRVRKIQEPIFMLNHYHSSDKVHFQAGLAYQIGSRKKSRLGYYNAPNPDPTYYRYLPSYYVNKAFGANFTNAALARKGFLEQAQINWESIYNANMRESEEQKAAYVLYDDVVEEHLLSIKSTANLILDDGLILDLGIAYRKSNSENFAIITDLLGAHWHKDIDPFSSTINDLNGSISKSTGDSFNYSYKISSQEIDGFLQLAAFKGKWDMFISGNLTYSSFFRQGLFLNERYPMNSFGKSRDHKFLNFGIKGGIIFKLSGRHWISSNTALIQRAPTYVNTFINSREHNNSVAQISNERISSVDLGYNFRFPDLKGRVTGYYTRFQDLTDINFFFVDAGLGSDFVQEAITDLDKLHLGIEISCKYQISSGVGLTFAGSMAKHLFANNPQLNIHFDNSGQENDIISEDGSVDLGKANIKDYKLSQGPQAAYSIGFDYRDPKYWWIGITANYLANNYPSISSIRRTSSFLLDPETTLINSDATEQKVQQLLRQAKLADFYLLNFTAGKSWLRNDKYISVFVSVNNVFNTIFKTGGFEQGRNGNYKQLVKDNLGGSPSFGQKYWYGFGRTFFLNMAISF